MPWHYIGGATSLSEQRFGAKVGHVLFFPPGPEPARWNAFFDGNFIRSAASEEEAKELVEKRAEFYVANLS